MFSTEYGCHWRSEEHTSELQSHLNIVCRLLLEKKKTNNRPRPLQRVHRARPDDILCFEPGACRVFDLFFLRIRRPPRPTLFPYTTLSRSTSSVSGRNAASADRRSPIYCSISALSIRRSEEHTSELQSHLNLVCRLLLE